MIMFTFDCPNKTICVGYYISGPGKRTTEHFAHPLHDVVVGLYVPVMRLLIKKALVL